MLKKIVKIFVRLMIMLSIYAGAFLFLTPYLHSYLQEHLAKRVPMGSVNDVSAKLPYAICFQSQKNNPKKLIIGTDFSLGVLNCMKREAKEYIRLIGGT